uniref:Uncharacterized protein n=1 Tax=Chromera velia CCMP2878 TaxID=1169474 RepID=A0A0G4I057_9ALVE|eukprot:Cvel_9872.t1-p1 / transcript=Cvel_9872.t1 / gene=Cvel_9872 / organism=Chromera_velia_CCMP2878 / gene_product=hypothetical protein / transcript_product=hypothetical protein / location=Cvel_scaffold582:12217-17630(+) / protein_length=755 / sequence_SO=supercontig / SO=protein_coding / is_pseudo=false
MLETVQLGFSPARPFTPFFSLNAAGAPSGGSALDRIRRMREAMLQKKKKEEEKEPSAVSGSSPLSTTGAAGGGAVNRFPERPQSEERGRDVLEQDKENGATGTAGTDPLKRAVGIGTGVGFGQRNPFQRQSGGFVQSQSQSGFSSSVSPAPSPVPLNPPTPAPPNSHLLSLQPKQDRAQPSNGPLPPLRSPLQEMTFEQEKDAAAPSTSIAARSASGTLSGSSSSVNPAQRQPANGQIPKPKPKVRSIFQLIKEKGGGSMRRPGDPSARDPNSSGSTHMMPGPSPSFHGPCRGPPPSAQGQPLEVNYAQRDPFSSHSTQMGALGYRPLLHGLPGLHQTVERDNRNIPGITDRDRDRDRGVGRRESSAAGDRRRPELKMEEEMEEGPKKRKQMAPPGPAGDAMRARARLERKRMKEESQIKKEESSQISPETQQGSSQSSDDKIGRRGGCVRAYEREQVGIGNVNRHRQRGGTARGWAGARRVVSASRVHISRGCTLLLKEVSVVWAKWGEPYLILSESSIGKVFPPEERSPLLLDDFAARIEGVTGRGGEGGRMPEGEVDRGAPLSFSGGGFGSGFVVGVSDSLGFDEGGGVEREEREEAAEIEGGHAEGVSLSDGGGGPVEQGGGDERRGVLDAFGGDAFAGRSLESGDVTDTPLVGRLCSLTGRDRMFENGELGREEESVSAKDPHLGIEVSEDEAERPQLDLAVLGGSQAESQDGPEATFRGVTSQGTAFGEMKSEGGDSDGLEDEEDFFAI